MLLKPPQLSLSRFSCAETDTEIDTNTRRKNETETETKPDHRAIRNWKKKQRETETEKQKAGSDLRNAANGTPDERYLNVEFIGNWSIRLDSKRFAAENAEVENDLEKHLIEMGSTQKRSMQSVWVFSKESLIIFNILLRSKRKKQILWDWMCYWWIEYETAADFSVI